MAKLNSAKLSQQIIPTFPPFLRILSACADWCSSNSSTSCFSSMPRHHPLCDVRLLHYLGDLPIVLSKLAVLCPQQNSHLQRYTIGLMRAPLHPAMFSAGEQHHQNKQHFKGCHKCAHEQSVCWIRTNTWGGNLEILWMKAKWMDSVSLGYFLMCPCTGMRNISILSYCSDQIRICVPSCQQPWILPPAVFIDPSVRISRQKPQSPHCGWSKVSNWLQCP